MPNEPDSLDQALDDCLRHASSEGILLRDMLERLGRSSFCFAALLLAVPFVQPFSLGPFTMMAAIALMIIGWQMGTGKSKPVLPQASAKLSIHGKGWVGVLRFCKRLLAFCRKFTRVRMPSWVSGAKGERFVGWLILAGGALIAVPAANLPFNNTLPALMVIFACVGWLERDGLMVMVSLAWGVATLLYFAAVIVALLFFGTQVWAWIGHFSIFR
ncbi:MAG: exopolysaccharide biosynthesis protein [Verrucomicrobia bacterium]|nr:exopolysaccharide biosynthesis protein [Verrucomicrobiota bacterium]